MNVQRTYVDVTLALDHSDVFDDDQIFEAVSTALPGMTLAEGSSIRLADGTVARHTILVEDVTEILVKGSTP